MNVYKRVMETDDDDEDRCSGWVWVFVVSPRSGMGFPYWLVYDGMVEIRSSCRGG